MSLQFDFDSAEHEGDGFEAYRALYSVGSDVARGRGPFRARARAVRLDSLILYEREMTGVVHARSARVAADGFDHFALHLVLEGRLIGSAESRFDSAAPGDLVMADTTRPSRTEAADLRLLTVSAPRSAIAEVAGSTARLHGARIGRPHTEPLEGLLNGLLRSAPQLPSRAHPALRHALIEVIGAALAELGPARRRDAGPGRGARHAALAYAMEHLGDRDLNAARIAAAIGVSRPRIYRLFAADGGVAEFIMSRRLGAVRDAIEAGSTEPLSVLALKHGFTDESHLNRRFTQAFGVPAGAYRRSLAAEAADEPAARRLQNWLTSLD